MEDADVSANTSCSLNGSGICKLETGTVHLQSESCADCVSAVLEHNVSFGSDNPRFLFQMFNEAFSSFTTDWRTNSTCLQTNLHLPHQLLATDGEVFGVAPSLQLILRSDIQQPSVTTCHPVWEFRFFLVNRGY